MKTDTGTMSHTITEDEEGNSAAAFGICKTMTMAVTVGK
jgi:hypothetical protein